MGYNACIPDKLSTIHGINFHQILLHKFTDNVMIIYSGGSRTEEGEDPLLPTGSSTTEEAMLHHLRCCWPCARHYVRTRAELVAAALDVQRHAQVALTRESHSEVELEDFCQNVLRGGAGGASCKTCQSPDLTLSSLLSSNLSYSLLFSILLLGFLVL
jgi:hypothetical protein